MALRATLRAIGLLSAADPLSPLEGCVVHSPLPTLPLPSAGPLAALAALVSSSSKGPAVSLSALTAETSADEGGTGPFEGCILFS
jgi:hypothetical protein